MEHVSGWRLEFTVETCLTVRNHVDWVHVVFGPRSFNHFGKRTNKKKNRVWEEEQLPSAISSQAILIAPGVRAVGETGNTAGYPITHYWGAFVPRHRPLSRKSDKQTDSHLDDYLLSYHSCVICEIIDTQIWGRRKIHFSFLCSQGQKKKRENISRWVVTTWLYSFFLGKK